MAHLLEPLFARLPYSHVYAHATSIVIAFLLITYMHVILGEIVPKSIALQRTEAVALAMAAPMDVFMTLGAPLLALMTTSSRLVLKAFGARQVREAGVHSSEELKLIVSASKRLGSSKLRRSRSSSAPSTWKTSSSAKSWFRGLTSSRCPATCPSMKLF